LKEPEIKPASSRAVELLENAGEEIPIDLALGVGRNVDALFDGEGAPLPSTVIVDYVYGVAAYKCWRSNINNVMHAYRNEHYASIKSSGRAPPDDTDDTFTSEPDDYNGSDYDPNEPRTPKSSPRIRRRVESGLAKTMDELNVFLMRIHGITPEEVIKRREKEIEQEERAAREASRIKVMEWRKHSRPDGS
jgi:hypothetical protein